MVPGKRPVPGRPTNFRLEWGKGQLRLQWVRVGVVLNFLLSSIISLSFLPLTERRPGID